jgi:hypothetical protein
MLSCSIFAEGELIAADQPPQHSRSGAGRASLSVGDILDRLADTESVMGGLVDNVMSNLSEAQIAAIATKLGTDPEQARNAIEHALPLIVGGMAQNASTAQGASALNNALREHAGFNVSDVLSGVLSGSGNSTSGSSISSSSISSIGGAILGHIFGGNQAAANQGLGQTTGLGQQNAGQLMAILAPIVMSALANHAQSQGLSPGGLGGMLGQESQQIQQQGGLVGGLLSAVLNHGGGNLDLSHLLQSAGGLLGAFRRH